MAAEDHKGLFGQTWVKILRQDICKDKKSNLGSVVGY